MEKISSAAFTDTKPHYDLLDGLRGVAALIVIWYHVFEGFAFASAGNIETLNHGYDTRTEKMYDFMSFP